MAKKLMSEVETENLHEILQSLEWEKEALEYTISQIESELFSRKHPELKKTYIDIFIEV